MSMRLADLRAGAAGLLGLTLTAGQIEAFAWYAEELARWNEQYNLTAITDPTQIEIKHFLDSLSCRLAIGTPAEGALVDVGSGAGFPGLPLKIVFPHLRLTLVESTGKKVRFCEHVVRGLRLENVEVVHGRVEDVGQDPRYRAQFEWALARAVAPVPVLAEYLLPLLKLGGRAVMMKGETGPAEAHTAESALRMLGGSIERMIPIELPQVAEDRFLVVIQKIAATPSAYPRRAGIPSKRPL